MSLSDHFSLDELTFSATALRMGLDNTPGNVEMVNLASLCLKVLEPVRALLKCPMHIDSGYRAPAVNKAVGSTSPHSDHMDGNACDFIPVGMALRKAFDLIRASDIPFKQLIIECNAWIHISHDPSLIAVTPRREALTASYDAGQWHYEAVV